MNQDPTDQESTRNRSPRIWDLACTALDAVLTSSFEWRELEDLARSEAEELPECGARQALHRCDRSLHDAHTLCHHPGRFARLVERQLDLKHRQVMNVVARQPVPLLRCLLLKQSLVACPDLGAVTWAVSRDPRPEVQKLLPLFLTRMQRIALHALCADSATL